MLTTKLVPALMAISLTACAVTADAGEKTLTGNIQIKGNEPFPIVMMRTSQETWELIGLPIPEARALEGRQASVTGTVARAPGPNVWLPSLRVNGKAKPAQP
ncbi:hypothetical protein [Cupriavidus plantarum]|uniref:hypothetical protein n=1 Tax=Cupriavidus plantarum TaxID=942865 RepID=UPI00339D6366